LSQVPNFKDRLSHAAEAKKAMLAKFRAAPGPDHPSMIEKRQERAAVVAARETRTAEREVARKAHEVELARQAEIAAEAAAEAERQRTEQAVCEAAEQAARDAAVKAEQKAARDIRYAARKAAKKERRRGY